ncbi:pseudouridine synthase [Ancylobacter sp.]|uniref:pseudouridine synthase n=1 Tax=Ancylobacter sp. TaxID=1872567 RepID=UPI003D113072
MPKNTPPRKDHNRVPRAARPAAPEEAGPREAERIAKVVARAGLGSRREIEEWILAGRVAVNDEVLESPARTVTAEDRITVDGVPLPDKERTRLFLYHKPKGVVTTNYDPEGRPTLFEILPAGLPRLVSVGRLDLNTEGLILLTNDGGLSRVLELPETGWLRRYRVRAKGDVTQDKLDALIAGITVDGVQYGPIEAVLDRVQGANVWLTLALREGKNREVRNVLGSLGLDVNRLIRLSYGPFQLGELPQGEAEEVRTRILADQLGETLAKAAGADFEGPMFNHGDEDAPKGAAKGAAKGAPKPRYAKPEGAEERHRRLPIDTEPGEGKSVKAGILADRKGRKVLVQRVRSTDAPAEDAPARAPARVRRDEERASVRTGERPGTARGERGGERTFRKRPDASAGEAGEGREERPFRERSGERPARAASSRDRKVGGPRPARPRDDREGDAGERSFRPRGDSDAPRAERPARGDRPERGERPFRERTPRPEGERGERPSRGSAPSRGERPERSERPARPERPEGGRSFRGAGTSRPYSGRVKSEQSRSFRPRPEGDERPARRERPEGDRPQGARPQGERPFRERTSRPEGERPARSFRPRPEGDERPARRERPEGGRPQGERPFRSSGDRPARDDRAPRGDRPSGGRSFGDKPAGGRSFGDKPAGGRSFGDKPAGTRTFGKGGAGKSYGAKNFADKPGGRPTGGKPGGRPTGGKPTGGKPAGGRPSGGKPSGGKPSGRPPRSPRS